MAPTPTLAGSCPYTFLSARALLFLRRVQLTSDTGHSTLAYNLDTPAYDDFERGNTDTYSWTQGSVYGGSLGGSRITDISLKMEGGTDWCLTYAKVWSRASSSQPWKLEGAFAHNDWVEDGQTAGGVLGDSLTDYKMSFSVCDEMWGGTDGTVNVRFESTKADGSSGIEHTKWVELDNAGRNDFTVGSTHGFEITSALAGTAEWLHLFADTADQLCITNVVWWDRPHGTDSWIRRGAYTGHKVYLEDSKHRFHCGVFCSAKVPVLGSSSLTVSAHPGSTIEVSQQTEEEAAAGAFAARTVARFTNGLGGRHVFSAGTAGLVVKVTTDGSEHAQGLVATMGDGTVSSPRWSCTTNLTHANVPAARTIGEFVDPEY